MTQQNPQGKRPNRLVHATSPYLLQHAYNPVEWFEWGTDALTSARDQNKPILVSIGYSSCHWCHVMERESFENDDIAEIMNDKFICIKVDREERPDIDHIYMEAVQAMGVNGGWPLNVFLTPDQRPFYGGTYFPPQNWSQLLIQVNKAFVEKRTGIDSYSIEISKHLNVSDLQRFGTTDTGAVEADNLHKMFTSLESRFDGIWGGLEKAPKFVMPTIWMFLLRHHYLNKNKDSLDMVSLTLTRLSEGGIYDQLGGGFSRYSVDARWFAPHFEKMLYDNAQLLTLYSEAFSVTARADFAIVVRATAMWMEREMTHRRGGIYSALDADSEGTEGKFYTWTFSEIETCLEGKTEAFTKYFQITPEGNWEDGRNILIRPADTPDPGFASEEKKLFDRRSGRVRPGLDDKILTGWNAMAVKGLTDAWCALGDVVFLNMAKRIIGFIEETLIHNGKVYRSFRDETPKIEGFLEDYAFLIQAYTGLYESTFEESYLEKASAWCSYTLSNFFDPGDGFFNFSSGSAEKLIASKKELFDNVIPASNSVMARNLYRLGVMLDKPEWRKIPAIMANQLRTIVQSEPSYFSNWGILLAEVLHGLNEIVIVGPQAEQKRQELAKNYLPFSVIMGAVAKSELPLFEGRNSTDDRTRIYVCLNRICKLPVEDVGAALTQLKESVS